ncbi:MAG TPA: DoxX family protein [Acidimicrobiales bacterium]|nr:DoxX family protein [Acidimicrobiales bacterium]
MRRLRPRERVIALAGVQLADAAFNAVPTQWLRDDLDHLGVPENVRGVFPVVKSASAVGLVAGLRWPRLGRLTANALIVYFLLALGFHARANDRPAKFAPAAGMLGWAIVTRLTFADGHAPQSVRDELQSDAGRPARARRPRAA